MACVSTGDEVTRSAMAHATAAVLWLENEGCCDWVVDEANAGRRVGGLSTEPSVATDANGDMTNDEDDEDRDGLE